jgi:plasmid stability protein
MATLIVRKLDDDLVQRLKARAKAHGRSAEAEHRLILQEALRPRRKMTGAELWEALRGEGPFFDDQMIAAMESTHGPAKAPNLES